MSVRSQPYRLPEHKRKESHSAWASPIVLVNKPDGTIRFCVDYRKVNSVSKFDAYPMPRVDELLDWLGTANFFRPWIYPRATGRFPYLQSPRRNRPSPLRMVYTILKPCHLGCLWLRPRSSGSLTAYYGRMRSMLRRTYRLQVTGYSFCRRFYPKQLTSSANNLGLTWTYLDYG